MKLFKFVKAMKKILKNKYLLTLVVFLLWMLFFDKNNFLEQYQLHADLMKLKQEQKYYLDQIESAKREREELFSNMASLEKFAREKYLMKKDNEDVFVIVEDK